MIAGTNPIHNKKPKKKVQDIDEDDVAHKAKLAAGAYSYLYPAITT
jgi:hypothetical protein